MKIEDFAVEIWMNAHETRCRYNIAESCVDSITVGALLGAFMSAALIASLTATGGVLLLGVGLRLLNIRQVPVGDLLPALLMAPVITAVVIAVRG